MDGGAVELSWKLRAASGASDNFVQCNPNGELLDSAGQPFPGADGLITHIRLHWQASKDGYAEFKCSSSHGVTTFVVPPGEALLWVRPVCSGGFEPDSSTGAPAYVAPAPEQRTVIAGDTVSLGAIELVLQVTNCSDTHPCVCR